MEATQSTHGNFEERVRKYPSGATRAQQSHPRARCPSQGVPGLAVPFHELPAPRGCTNCFPPYQYRARELPSRGTSGTAHRNTSQLPAGEAFPDPQSELLLTGIYTASAWPACKRPSHGLCHHLPTGDFPSRSHWSHGADTGYCSWSAGRWEQGTDPGLCGQGRGIRLWSKGCVTEG